MSHGNHLEAHLFICTNLKEKGESCAKKGSTELRNRLKEICQDEGRGWHGRVRVNASGCLGRCAEGIAAVLYPKGEWFTQLNANDTEILESALKKTLDERK